MGQRACPLHAATNVYNARSGVAICFAVCRSPGQSAFSA